MIYSYHTFEVRLYVVSASVSSREHSYSMQQIHLKGAIATPCPAEPCSLLWRDKQIKTN